VFIVYEQTGLFAAAMLAERDGNYFLHSPFPHFTIQVLQFDVKKAHNFMKVINITTHRLLHVSAPPPLTRHQGSQNCIEQLLNQRVGG